MTGAVPACKWVRLAVERNRRDLARAAAGDAAFPYRFDEAVATRICVAAESLPHIKGPKAQVVGRDDQGRMIWATIQLEPWQCWLLTTIFGWIHAETGLRRFRLALVLVPRKNAKSTLAAVVTLYMLTSDGESGAECYSLATTRDQAKIVAELAWEMTRRSPAFREYFGVRVGAKTTRTLEVPGTASRFGPLSADANSLDGLNISLAIIDELHAHRTRAVWDVVETATGARPQPLILAITTAGSNIAGICYEVLGYIRKLLERTASDETAFGVEYTVDEGDAWDAESSWRKANPNYGVSVMPADLVRKAEKARHTQAAVDAFRTKHLNIWVQGESAWLQMEEWHACADAALTLEQLAADKVPCWIGVDLAEVRDIAAVVLVFRLGPERIAVFGQYFLPEATITTSPTAQYPGWVRQGWLTPTDGNVADYQRIEDAIWACCQRYHVIEIDFDRALAAQMQQRLAARLGPRPPVVTVSQDLVTMNSAMQTLEALVSRRSLVHNGDPVLTWMASNVVVARNYKDEIYPRKAGGKDSHNKIDGIVALLTALSRASLPAESERDYQMLILGRSR